MEMWGYLNVIAFCLGLFALAFGFTFGQNKDLDQLLAGLFILIGSGAVVLSIFSTAIKQIFF